MTAKVNLAPELLSPYELAAAKAEAATALREVAHLLATPYQWTQGARARDARALPCGVGSPTAVRWCLLGALDLKTVNRDRAVSILAERALAAVVAPAQISSFNDGCRTAVQVASAARIAANTLEE